MSEPDHLPKANHLRFSIVLFAIVVVALCIVVVQKISQARIDADLQKQRDEYTALGKGRRLNEEPIEEPKLVTPQKPAAVRPSAPLPPPPTPKPVAPEETNAESSQSVIGTSTAAVPGKNVVVGINRGTVAAGTITGTILLHGTPPPEKVIEPLLKDPTCGKMWSNAPTTRFYIVDTNGGLANVFVYLKGNVNYSRAQKYATTKSDALLDNIGCMFEPYVLGIVKGQSLRIRNSDPVLHNAHVTGARNPEFNFALPRQGQIRETFFVREEVMVRIKCDVHPWMFAYVGVVAHPFFAVTDTTGHFEINDVPPGTYTLEAVHLKAGRLTAEVTTGTESPDVSLTFELPQN